MSLSVGSQVRQMAADGYFGKRDLEAATTDMLDGRGITHTEKRAYVKAFGEALANPDVYVTDTAKRAFDRLEDRMGHYSQGKEAYAPTLDKAEIKDILSDYTEGRVVYSGGESPMATRMGGRAETGGTPRDIGAEPPAPRSHARYSGGE